MKKLNKGKIERFELKPRNGMNEDEWIKYATIRMKDLMNKVNEIIDYLNRKK